MPFVIDSFYLSAATLGAPYIVAKLFVSERFRSGLMQKLGWLPERRGSAPCFWVHAASVGEMLTSRPLVKALEETFSDWEVILSTNTNTGLSVARKDFGDKLSFYFPFDLSWLDRKALTLLRPACILLVELEIWPNFLVAAHERRIPVIVVNGRISAKSVRAFKAISRLSGAFREALNARENFYCARSQADASRFLELGIAEERVLVTGNVKYDSLPVEVPLERKERLRQIFKLRPEDLVLVGGSTHPGEEEILLRVFKTLKTELPALRLILVPRHIERAPEIEEKVLALGLPCVRRSGLAVSEANLLEGQALNPVGSGQVIPPEREGIIVVDTVGELQHIYSLAHCVFVGKSLKGIGGQNVMEPAGLARPILFGPHMENFSEEANLLLESGGARKVGDEGELLRAVRDVLTHSQPAEAMGQRAREVVLKNRGATLRSLEVLERLLKGDKN
ncbi:MAG: 3-deoxy-D-manno-octulosonic acid transferase [Planctomycetes bacterium]|nr:3-deoxy-D-manno-octulosonic acid transferase [Planctomycetota bacterium]